MSVTKIRTILDKGGKAGWGMLREINRQWHLTKPGIFTVAEQFDYDPAFARPTRSDGTGGGFDAQWYSEWQHRMVNESAPFNPGLVQAASRGWRPDMDKFLGMLGGPRGLDDRQHALTIISNPDEVGNAQRTIAVAEGTSSQTNPANGPATPRVPPPNSTQTHRNRKGLKKRWPWCYGPQRWRLGSGKSRVPSSL